MTRTTAQEGFSAYGPSHWAVLAVFAAGVAALVLSGRRHRHHPTVRRRFSRGFALLLLALHLGAQLYTVAARQWQPLDAVPLHLSDLAGFVTAYALWSHRRWAYALTYYWGLTLSAQALVTPVLDSPDFPHHEFLAFWTLHLLVIWAAVYLTWGVGMRPGWRDYGIAVGLTATWAGAAFVFNSVTGTNYGFLNGKPATDSLLDLLGPWPWYLLPEVALILAAWALLTWPWTRRTARAGAGRARTAEGTDD